jgi:hypothetical protein
MYDSIYCILNNDNEKQHEVCAFLNGLALSPNYERTESITFLFFT